MPSNFNIKKWTLLIWLSKLYNHRKEEQVDWTENSLWTFVKMRNSRPNNVYELKAAIKAIWASIIPQQNHTLITSMPQNVDPVIHAKRGPVKYWREFRVFYDLILIKCNILISYNSTLQKLNFTIWK